MIKIRIKRKDAVLVTLNLLRVRYRKFKKKCRDEGTSVSAEVDKLIKERLNEPEQPVENQQEVLIDVIKSDGYKTTTSIRIDAAVFKMSKKICDIKNISLGGFIDQCVKEALKRYIRPKTIKCFMCGEKVETKGIILPEHFRIKHGMSFSESRELAMAYLQGTIPLNK